jgi:hypothetical protein
MAKPGQKNRTDPLGQGIATMMGSYSDTLDPLHLYSHSTDIQPDLPVPAVPSPPVMPIPDDDAIRRRRRRSIAAQQQRQGRASTFLSAEDALGGA